MTTHSRDPKGDTRSGHQIPTADGNVPHDHESHTAEVRRIKGDGSNDLGRTLIALADNDGGYLKVRRSSLSPDLHLTWTWTLGPHSGRYVYVRVPFWQLAYGLALLAEKMAEADSGKLKPSPDKRGSGHYSS